MEKANIMIVEDESIVAQDIKATLESLGYTVAGIAFTGNDAITKTSETKPDLILMDIKLKGEMDGIEASKKISDSFKIPIVFLTAYADNKIISKVKNPNVFGYIVKPFDEKNLNSTLQMALQRYREIEKSTTLQDNIKDLNLYDRKILYEIDVDARISASEIGKKLRLPKGTINYRINKLVENGYINKFYTIINASMLGYQYYRIFIKFYGLTPEIEKSITEFINKEKNCIRLRVTEGAFNLIFFTIHNNLGELRKFLENFNQRFGSYILERDINTITMTHKYNQRFLLDTKDYGMLSIRYENTGGYDADETDKKIINLLSKNARAKLIDMAKELKIDWKVIKYRIDKMKNKGVIVAYTAELNLPKLDRQIIQIDISVRDLSAINDIIGFFSNTNACVFIHEMIGKYDLSAELYVKNDDILKKILSDFQKIFVKKVVSYDVFHVYRDYAINSFPYEAKK